MSPFLYSHNLQRKVMASLHYAFHAMLHCDYCASNIAGVAIGLNHRQRLTERELAMLNLQARYNQLKNGTHLTRKRVHKRRYGVRFLAHSVAIDIGKRSTYFFWQRKSDTFGKSVRNTRFEVN